MNKDYDAYYTALRIDPERMTAKEFFALGEYSCSQPTGVFFGKQWRSNLNAYRVAPPVWVLREFTPIPDKPTHARTITTAMHFEVLA